VVARRATSALPDRLHNRQDADLDGFGQVRPSGEDGGEVGGGWGEFGGKSAKKIAKLIP